MALDYKSLIEGGEESKELDYKGPLKWGDDKKEKCELVKDILALANTKGGWIVIGVEETATGFKSTGLTKEQADSFDSTKINSFLNNYSDPPINATMVKNKYDGKTYVIISVPRFPDTPHICQKDYPEVLKSATIYVRTDSNESAPIKSSSDVRELIETALRNRSSVLLKSIQHIIKHGEEVPQMTEEQKYTDEEKKIVEKFNNTVPKWADGLGFRNAVFYPANYNPERFSLPKLREMAERASISYTGWPFIFISRSRADLTYNVDDGIETKIVDKETDENPIIQLWKLNQSGILIVRELLFEERKFHGSGETAFVDFLWLCQYAGLTVDCLAKLFDGEIEDSEVVKMKFRLTGMKDKLLGSFQRGRDIRPNHLCRIEEITYESSKSIAEWKSDIVGHSVAICEHIFHRFNWDTPNLYEARKIIEKMFERRFD